MKASDRKTEGWIEDTVGALCDPIIVMPGGWGDDLPESLRNRVNLERLLENMLAMQEHREITATDAEAVCYLFTASLTAPIGGDWTTIYMYVSGKVMKAETKAEIPEDLKVDKLTDYQLRELNHLKHWIYEQRVKHRKERALQKKPAANNKELEAKPVQPAFF